MKISVEEIQNRAARGLALASRLGDTALLVGALFANHRSYAARMATAVSGVFLVGSIALRDHLGVGAIATSVVFFAIACASLAIAHQRFTRLVERRRALEGEK